MRCWLTVGEEIRDALAELNRRERRMPKGFKSRAAKVDARSAVIVQWLREQGAHVIHLSDTFDLAVGMFGRWDVVELKSFGGSVRQSQYREAIAIVEKGLPAPIVAETAEEVVTEMRRRARKGVE